VTLLRARDSGFTLLEILVVIVIIGVMVSMATLSIGVLGADRQVEEETRRFWAVLRQAREEAELQAIDVAIFVGATDYEFMRFDTRRNEWTPIVDDQLYAQRALPDGLRFRLWLENREIVLKPGLPDRSKKDESQKWPPQLTVLSSGDVVPFELHVERDAAPALWRMTSLADGDLRIEQRKDERDWAMVAQTKPPPEDDRNKERISSARR
jgi:general secretion pathway protein H